MSDSASRRTIARAAARLAAAKQNDLPVLVLMTDDARLKDPVAAARALPRGSMVIVRSRDDARRRDLALALREIARVRGLFLLIAGDAALAARIGADGVHLPETRLGDAAAIRGQHKMLVTAAAHSLSALRRAKYVDALILSAVFPTASHPGRAALGAVRANLMVRQAPVPVYALGGITARNARLLAGFCGIAAIGVLGVDPA
jgi:thiamine-phosphate pyrophosphorylase